MLMIVAVKGLFHVFGGSLKEPDTFLMQITFPGKEQITFSNYYGINFIYVYG